MPAHNESYPWANYYGNYRFFEDRMNSHRKISNLHHINDGFYEIVLTDGRALKVFICECYSFGMAEYYETVENLGELNAVIINSKWCGYTMEAKFNCKNNNVGLFDISGFMAALNMNNYWEYATKDENKYFKEKGWI